MSSLWNCIEADIVKSTFALRLATCPATQCMRTCSLSNNSSVDVTRLLIEFGSSVGRSHEWMSFQAGMRISSLDTYTAASKRLRGIAFSSLSIKDFRSWNSASLNESSLSWFRHLSFLVPITTIGTKVAHFWYQSESLFGIRIADTTRNCIDTEPDKVSACYNCKGRNKMTGNLSDDM